MGIDYVKRNIFRTFNISIHQNHEFLCHNSSSRRLLNDPNRKEIRVRPHIISDEKLREMKRILQEEKLKYVY